jgi:SGNH hydrolase-like domain, acetyltransferase AlgX
MPFSRGAAPLLISLAIVAAGCTGASPDASRRARAETMKRDADELRAECQTAAAGDWECWERQTQPYRETLKKKIDSLKRLKSVILGGPRPALEGLNDFPLFEINAQENLVHIYDPASLAGFRKDRAVVAAHRWLKRRGIDLIFVPVPKMAEVYIEHFVESAPSDGIIAPHVRQTLLELLEAGVETVDAFSVLRAQREPNPEYLYNTADTHWAPRGMRIVAAEIARRLGRYDFGAAASKAPAVVQATLGPYETRAYPFEMKLGDLPRQDGWLGLTDRQQSLAEKVQTRTCEHISVADDFSSPADPHSPVMLIGHSYAYNFREILTKEANLLLRSDLGDQNTTEAFADFLRDSSLLAGVRVVVWITTEKHMTDFRPMPPPIMAALGSDN